MPIQTYRRATIAALLGLISCVGSAGLGRSQPDQGHLQLTTHPPLAQTIPLHQPVQLSLTAQDAKATPLKQVRFQLQLLTPSKTPWFSTDFPMVEGTTLFKWEAIAPDGKLTLQQGFPIRGNYHLQVKATPLIPGAFTPIEQTFTLTVPENPIKYRNFALLTVILLLVGYTGGWVIGAQQAAQPGEVAPERVRLLLSGAIVVAILTLLAINLSAEKSHAHGDHTVQTDLNLPSTLKSEEIQLHLSGGHQATVGQLHRFTVKAVQTQTGQPITDAIFRVRTVQLEENELTMAYHTATGPAGQWSWEQQFFDGAPHRVEVEIAPRAGSSQPFQPIRVAQVVDVEGIAPPLTTRLTSLAYFMGILGVGFTIGFWQQRLRLSLHPCRANLE